MASPRGSGLHVDERSSSVIHVWYVRGASVKDICLEELTQLATAGAPVYIYRELGGIDHWVWFVSANLLATAAISPFVGALSDLVGRRFVALAGNALIVIGQIICGAATSMDAFIGKS